ncbi:unnamed protein product, partial [Sphacelaria rigidula]
MTHFLVVKMLAFTSPCRVSSACLLVRDEDILFQVGIRQQIRQVNLHVLVSLILQGIRSTQWLQLLILQKMEHPSVPLPPRSPGVLGPGLVGMQDQESYDCGMHDHEFT